MIKNYLKIAFRNLFKHKLYSAINIFGLAVGIACCVLIGLYVHNEWSYDEFHTNSDRLYRAWGHEDYGEGEVFFNTRTPIILASTLESYIPEVEETTHFYNFNNKVKRPEQTTSISETVSMVDPAFFRMFDFPFIKGNSESIFANPGEVVITEDIAKRYFGDQDPRRKIMSIKVGETFQDFTITGIVRNLPDNSSIQFDLLIPFSNSTKFFGEILHTSWFDIVSETYVLLRENVQPEDIRPELDSMMQSVLNEESDLRYTVGFQPITDIHLNTDMPKGIPAVSDPKYSYFQAAIALLILLIACVNFMTLSISRSVSRAKEVGIRKTVGARRQHLMYQFWGEALLMTFFALGLGVLMAELLLPWFNSLSGTELTLTFGMDVMFSLVAAAVIISIIAGIYPALILSGFRPVEVLKGRLNLSGDKNFFRRAMVVFQFTLSIALIAGTLMIARQLNYMRSTDLGYQKEQVVVLETDIKPGSGNSLSKVLQEAGRLKNRLNTELRTSPGIEQISMSLYTPVQFGGWITADFKESNGRKREFHFNIVDHDFVDTYEIEVVQGRNFSEENPSDQRRAILVNQALVNDYGWKNPIGQQLSGPDFQDHEVIGVVENFHYESLHIPVEPLVLVINPQLVFQGTDNRTSSGSRSPRISLHLSTDDLPATMNTIERSWFSVVSDKPFNYTFVDQAVDNQYRQEDWLSQIVAFGSALAIIISCLGLFGLASLMIERRTKEIGIRKVLGASASNIILMVNKEFTKLVIIAFAIAVPIAWYVMSQWLQDFAYRIDIGIGVFLLTGIIALAIAWLTVSYQSVKATLINPVESLKNE